MMPNRVARCLLCLLVFLCWIGVGGGVVLAQVPPHLDIVSATVEELPPIDRENVPGRTVAVRLVVSAAPVCNAATGYLVYGVLADTDSNPATGVTDPAFDGLGVEARVTTTCDPAAAAFVSPIGTVTVTPGPGSTAIEIRTTVEKLPSLDFRWIAFAQENLTFSRLPQAPEYGHWMTSEKGVF